MAAKVKIPTPSAPLRAGSCAKDAQGWGTRLDFERRQGKSKGDMAVESHPNVEKHDVRMGHPPGSWRRFLVLRAGL
jgi:hypothetical protein